MPFDPPERPAGNYEPHPAGTYIGTITEIKDYGKMDSLYRTPDGNTKEVHRVAIVVTAEELQMESGDPWSHFEFVNISFAPKSRLTELRNLLRDVDLTNAELNAVFDETVEMIGRKVKYKIRHKKNDDNDKIRAVIHDWEYADNELPDLATTTQKDAAKEAVKKAFDGEVDDLPF